MRLLPVVHHHLHGWPLPWGGQRPDVFHRVRSSCYRAGDRKPRVRVFLYPVHLYHNTVQYPSAGFRYREGASPLAGDELQGRRVDEAGLLFFFVGLFSVSARRAAGVKSGNSLGPLTAAFLRVVAVGAFDVTPGTDDELRRVMTVLCGIDVSRSRISNARRRGRKPEKMRECFGAIPATDEGFIRRLYRTRPEVLRRVLLPLLTPQSAAIRRLEEILAEEDEAELVRSNVEWLERFHNAVRDDALITEFGR